MFPRRNTRQVRGYAGTIPFMHVLGTGALALTMTELLNATFLPRKTVDAATVARLGKTVLVDVSPFEEPNDVVGLTGRALTAALYGVKYVCVMQDDSADGMELAARNAILRMNPAALVVSAGTSVYVPGREQSYEGRGKMFHSIVHVNDLVEVLSDRQSWAGWLTVGPDELVPTMTILWAVKSNFWKMDRSIPNSPMVVTTHPQFFLVK